MDRDQAESKLLISYLVGARDAEYASLLMDDLRDRLASRGAEMPILFAMRYSSSSPTHSGALR